MTGLKWGDCGDRTDIDGKVVNGMAKGKSINLYLMDGDVNGRIKCSLANWAGLAFKIPRTSLDLCKDRPELKQTGIYFLFGKDDNDRGIVYVGQAGVRNNGEGILYLAFHSTLSPFAHPYIPHYFQIIMCI